MFREFLKVFVLLTFVGSVVGTGALVALTTQPEYPPIKVMGTLMHPVDVNALVRKASKYSRYSMPWFRRPKVDIVPNDVWVAQVCGGFECGAIGYYDPINESPEIVHIRAKFNADGSPIPDDMAKVWTDSQNATAVHEVVHWLQTRKPWRQDYKDCTSLQAHEVEAYTAQYMYQVLEEGVEKGFWFSDLWAACKAPPPPRIIWRRPQ